MQVTCLSEITTGDGVLLQPGFPDQQQQHLRHHSAITWPKQATPNAHAWRMWRNALVHTFLPINCTTLQLSVPLG